MQFTGQTIDIDLQVVNTAKGLDNLLLNSVILIKGQPRIKRHDGKWLGVGKDSGSTAIDSDYIIYWYNKVEVLYAPDGPVND